MSAIEKLTVGDTFPQLKLTTVGGAEITLPDDIETEYAIVLFYRGHWCPFCRRMLEGFERHREEFASYGFSIFAGAVDSEEHTAEVAATLNFSVAHSMTRVDGDTIGAWWDEGRGHIQPSEFILSGEGKILSSTYSNSPLGRMDPDETMTLMKLILTKDP